jgi:Flp pilus assembly protein TadG
MIDAFGRQESGSVLILFSLAAVALMLIIGLTLDYSRALSRKTVLRTANDAAALTALSQAEADYQAGNGWGQMKKDAEAAALNSFIANAGSDYSLLDSTPTINMTRNGANGQTIDVSVSFSAKSPNAFAAMAHVANMNLSGTSQASLTFPNYLNFYMLLDVSGSMGIPSTNSEQTRLAAVNPDFLNLYPGGCTIACHFNATNFPAACQDVHGNSTACKGFDVSRTAGQSNMTPVAFCPQPGMSNCIQLRLDAVAYAVQQLALTAQKIESAQHRTDLFGFGVYPFAAQLATYQPVTSNVSSVVTMAPNLTSLVDSGGTDSIGPNAQSVGSGGTHFENALGGINGIITNVGNGTSASAPLPFVFLVTDGAQDSQYQVPTKNADGTWSPAWSGSNRATTLDTTYCDAIKNRNITLAILEIPYVPIQNPTTIWNDEDDYANSNAPLIPPVMQTCASPGYYFTASSPSDINTALQQMFAKAVAASTPHLTQ